MNLAVLEEEVTCYFYLSVAKFKAGANKAFDYAKNGITNSTQPYKVAYSVIGDKRYADGEVLSVQNIVKSAKTLSIELNNVKLKDWQIIQTRSSPRPEDRNDRNIRLISKDEVRVILFNSPY